MQIVLENNDATVTLDGEMLQAFVVKDHPTKKYDLVIEARLGSFTFLREYGVLDGYYDTTHKVYSVYSPYTKEVRHFCISTNNQISDRIEWLPTSPSVEELRDAYESTLNGFWNEHASEHVANCYGH